jgi:hypothetical protein
VAFLGSLLLSSVFWLLTSLSNVYVDEVHIPVVYQGIPEDAIITSDLKTDVTAEVKGFGFDLIWFWLRFEKIQIEVNADPKVLPRLTKHGQRYHYVLTDDKSGGIRSMKDEQLEILSISPDTLFIRFEPKFSKKVPVKLNAKISCGKQFGLAGEPALVPDSIMLFGPEEEVRSITSISTEAQIWKELNESVTAEIGLSKKGIGSVVQFSDNSVQVQLNVVEFTEGTLTVPVEVNANGLGSIKVFPGEVEIKYLVPLAKYESVSSDQFQVSVTLDGNQKGQTSLVVNIDRTPDFVNQVRVNPTQVEFIIQK